MTGGRFVAQTGVFLVTGRPSLFVGQEGLTHPSKNPWHTPDTPLSRARVVPDCDNPVTPTVPP